MASYALSYDSYSWCPGSKGDLVVFKRPAGYDHYAVNIGNGYIVHRTEIDATDSLDVVDAVVHIPCCSSSNVAIVKKEKFKDFYKPGDKVEVEDHPTPFSRVEIVSRALSKIGQRGFNLLWKNCEHFARWCRYGEEKSEQADLLKIGIGVGVGALAIGGAALLINALSDTSPKKSKENRQ